MTDPHTQKLTAFVRWCEAHITGDEKGQAQIFLDRLFQAFGHGGSLDVGGSPEFRVRKSSQDGGGTSFADYVWKPVVLIEMKRRGEKLAKHYRQAFDYWTRLVPNRPRYSVLCNFDEFWVFDFETQMDTPVGKVKLSNLPSAYGPLAFLLPGQPAPVFENDRVAVTQAAADKLAACFNRLVKRGVERPLAQRFILQTLVAVFAEDIDLLEKYFVTRLLAECTPKTSFDLIGGLFRAMNTPGGTKGGRFKGVPYFNGGVFQNPAELDLESEEIAILLSVAKDNDWSQVQPEIFGTIFQHSLGAKERHAHGAHFTHPADIMKIVGPTIAEPWREQVEGAKTLKRLRELIDRLANFRVLDPACGSGNFLYIAYRELKRIEARIIERMEQEFKSEMKHADQRRLSFLSAKNFYGMDINPFAVELAKVTMVIARKLAIDELHITEKALPLDNLDTNFRAADALIVRRDGSYGRTPWPKADVVIGNPPFLGAKLLKPSLGPDYVNNIRGVYPEIPGMADLCVYWVARAHDHVPACTVADPVSGRVGLVGTQNIRSNQSRVGGLDRFVIDGTIVEAVDNQPWSGEANVSVSIVNWVKSQDDATLPKVRRLWFKVEPPASQKGTPAKKGSGPASKTYQLDCREVAEISSSLSDKRDVSEALALTCNTDPQRCFTGQMIGHDGFLLTKAQRAELVGKEPAAAKITFPHLIGKEFLAGNGTPERYVIDFGQLDQLHAAAYTKTFDLVRRKVLPDRERKAKEGADKDGNFRPHHKQFLSHWWQLSFSRIELTAQIEKLPRYIVCSRVTKRPVFVFVSSSIRPGDALSCFTFADDYSFGILQSAAHWQWFLAKCSNLTERLRYSPESVFNTFPWPQDPDAKNVRAVASAGRDLRAVRSDALKGIKGGLRALYRTMDLPGKNPLRDAHLALDAAVRAAYGFGARADLLTQLLRLNQNVAELLKRGEAVTAPGIPDGFADTKKLISTDCIR